LTGDRTGAEKHLRELLDATPYSLSAAMLHVGLGNKKEAIKWLEKSRDDRDPHVITASFDPRFASLYDEPQFWQLLDQIGLASAALA